MAVAETRNKKVSEVLDFGFDLNGLIGTDTINSVTFSIDSGPTLSGGAYSNTTKLCSVFISGGTLNALYTLRATIVTAGGRTHEPHMFISIIAD